MAPRLATILFRDGKLTRIGWLVLPVCQLLFVALVTWASNQESSWWLQERLNFICVILFAIMGGLLASVSSLCLLLWAGMQVVLAWNELRGNEAWREEIRLNRSHKLNWTFVSQFSLTLLGGLSYCFPFYWYLLH